MANSEMLEILSQEELKRIQNLESILSRIEKQIEKINSINLKGLNSPSQNRGGTSNNNSNTASANKLLAEQQRLLDRISDAKKKEAIENAKLRLELAKLNAENKKAAQDALGAMSSYQRLSAELNQLRSEAKAVAADMYLQEQAGEQNGEQYQQLSNTYANLSQRVNNLHHGLTRIDRGLGDHRREVGNYENGWNSLGNSINQLTREAPAFVNSMQTGFMAISNNLPALADALADISRENERLRAQGQPTVSALRQVASALFSWQTAISATITALTVLGPKIIDWISNLNSASKEVDLLTQAQERFNNTTSETVTQSQEQYNVLNKLQGVIRSTTATEEEKADARKKLVDMFPAYFKSEQDIINNTKAYQIATQELTDDILKRADAEAKQKAASENLKIAADIEQEVALRERTNNELLRIESEYGGKYAEYQRKIIKAQVDARREALEDDAEFKEKFYSVGQATTGRVDLLGAYDQSAIHELKRRAEALRAEYKRQQELTTEIFKDTYKLEVDAVKDAKEAEIEMANDYLVNLYEFNRLELEGRIATQKEILENEENGLADREAAHVEYSKLLSELAELDRAERIRVIEKTTDDEIAELRRRAKEGEVTQQSANRAVFALNKQRNIDIRTASEQFSQDMKKVTTDITESQKSIYDTLPEQARQRKETEQQIANLREMSLILDNIGGGTTGNQFVQVENQLRKIGQLEQDQQVELLRMQREEIQGEISKIQAQEKSVEGNEAIAKLQQQQLNIDKQILEVELRKKQAIADTYAEMRRSTQEYFNQFSNGIFGELGLTAVGGFFDEVQYQVVNSLGEIETKSGSTFQRLFDQAQGTGAKMKVVFLQMSEIAQEAFNSLQQYSQQRYENEIAEIDMQQRLAERFAQTEEARQAIQDQSDAKRREARRKEAQQQKEIALFNAVINTAQAVVAALPNIPLSVIIGALGAAQIALIASQEIPEFKEGVRGFGGGLAIVGDGGRHEVVRTPDGGLWRTPDTDTLVNLPKGSDVFKSDMDFLRNSGALLGGMPHMLGDMNGWNAAEMDRIMEKHLAGAASNHINITKNGIQVLSVKANARSISHNNSITFKSRTFN